jgi:hypothetical protein
MKYRVVATSEDNFEMPLILAGQPQGSILQQNATVRLTIVEGRFANCSFVVQAWQGPVPRVGSIVDDNDPMPDASVSYKPTGSVDGMLDPPGASVSGRCARCHHWDVVHSGPDGQQSRCMHPECECDGLVLSKT